MDPELKARSHFHAFALGGKDDFGPGKNPPFYTLQTLMKLNGHGFIDVLKVIDCSQAPLSRLYHSLTSRRLQIDIEGAEFDVLTELLKEYKDRPLPFGQLQLEIHAWKKE